MADCPSLFDQNGCCHSCIHDEGHEEEKHVCGCGVEWDNEEGFNPDEEIEIN